MEGALPVTESEIDEFIGGFQNGTLPKEFWTHGAHVLTGACYVYECGETEAIARMRRDVAAYNVAVGGKNTESSGYHETITIFWLKLLSAYRSRCPDLTRAEFAARAVAEFVHRRDILREYYDFDVTGSTEARRSWICPKQHIL